VDQFSHPECDEQQQDAEGDSKGSNPPGDDEQAGDRQQFQGQGLARSKARRSAPAANTTLDVPPQADSSYDGERSHGNVPASDHIVQCKFPDIGPGERHNAKGDGQHAAQCA
jgi:hypothetical protein